MGMPFVVVALLALSSAQRVTSVQEIPVGVWYVPAAGADPEVMRRDLDSIRRSGFDSITTPLIWKEVEPRRGTYNFLAAERLIAIAGRAGLRVRVKVMTDSPPAWATSIDAVYQFMDYTRRRMVLHPAVVSVEAMRSGDALPNERIPVGAVSPRDARLRMWTAIAEGHRGISFDDGANGATVEMRTLGELAGIITRNQSLFGPLRRREAPGTATVEGGNGVAVHVLESADAIVIIGLNPADASQKVTVRFAPDIPEAIWINIEEGVSVNFVMGKDGPFFAHTFAAHDALVLTIRKKLR